MKKQIFVAIMLIIGLLAGCSLIPQFEKAKEEYLETRVVELLEEPDAEETMVEELEEEEPAAEAEEKPTEEAVPTEEETEEVDEPEETPEAEETPEETEVPEEEPEPTIESDDPAVYLGEADWVDDMETGEYWSTQSGVLTSAAFENGTLKLTALSETNGWRIASTPTLGNVYIEADVKMGDCRETDGYGFIFRVPENVNYNQGYLFGVTCDGRYALRKWNGLTGEEGLMLWLKYYTLSELINKGPNQSNRIGVMALDDRIVLFVNGEKVDEIVDEKDPYAEGFFGLYINRDRTENLSINVETVSYWSDPQEK